MDRLQQHASTVELATWWLTWAAERAARRRCRRRLCISGRQQSVAKANMHLCANVICDFLQSKCLVAAERALRTELELLYHRSADSDGSLMRRNLWHSRLEKMLDARVPRSSDADTDGSESPQMGMLLSQIGALTTPSAGGDTPTHWGSCCKQTEDLDAGGSSRSTPSRRLGVRLHQLHPSTSEEEATALRRQRNRSAQQSCVVFREGKPMTDEQAGRMETLLLPLLYNPFIRGLEDSPELIIDEGTLLAGRYRVVALIGKGSFSRVVQCYDERDSRSVSVKILHNDKDCVDQGIGEVRLLTLLAERDPAGDVPLLRLIDYFYYKEHLLIVTELLRDSIFNFYRYLRDTSPEGHGAYFSLDTLRTLATQLLTALAFMHKHDIVHCDLKPENVCLASASRRKFKIIDVGSAVLGHDVHFSYVQTRGYRAPEVMLGLPWGEKIDMWGVGCILAELVIGQQLFHGPSVEHVLAAQQAVLGQLPEHMVRAAATRSLYFTPQGHLYTLDPPSYPPGAYRLLPIQTDLQTLFDEIDDDGFLSFVASLLALDPERRPTATEALSHPWLHPGEPVSAALPSPSAQSVLSAAAQPWPLQPPPSHSAPSQPSPPNQPSSADRHPLMAGPAALDSTSPPPYSNPVKMGAVPGAVPAPAQAPSPTLAPAPPADGPAPLGAGAIPLASFVPASLSVTLASLAAEARPEQPGSEARPSPPPPPLPPSPPSLQLPHPQHALAHPQLHVPHLAPRHPQLVSTVAAAAAAAVSEQFAASYRPAVDVDAMSAVTAAAGFDDGMSIDDDRADEIQCVPGAHAAHGYDDEILSASEEAAMKRAHERRERRNSGDGPSVPQEFREAALAESSRSHEWRQKLMRIAVGNSRSASRNGSRNGSPMCAVRRDGTADVAVDALGQPSDSSRDTNPPYFLKSNYVP